MVQPLGHPSQSDRLLWNSWPIRCGCPRTVVAGVLPGTPPERVCSSDCGSPSFSLRVGRFPAACPFCFQRQSRFPCSQLRRCAMSRERVPLPCSSLTRAPFQGREWHPEGQVSAWRPRVGWACAVRTRPATRPGPGRAGRELGGRTETSCGLSSAPVTSPPPFRQVVTGFRNKKSPSAPGRSPQSAAPPTGGRGSRAAGTLGSPRTARRLPTRVSGRAPCVSACSRLPGTLRSQPVPSDGQTDGQGALRLPGGCFVCRVPACAWGSLRPAGAAPGSAGPDDRMAASSRPRPGHGRPREDQLPSGPLGSFQLQRARLSASDPPSPQPRTAPPQHPPPPQPLLSAPAAAPREERPGSLRPGGHPRALLCSREALPRCCGRRRVRKQHGPR